MTDVAYAVVHHVRFEGDSVVAVWLTEPEAIGLRNRLNKRCDDGFGEYLVRTVPLNPDPVEMTRSVGEVSR